MIYEWKRDWRFWFQTFFFVWTVLTVHTYSALSVSCLFLCILAFRFLGNRAISRILGWAPHKPDLWFFIIFFPSYCSMVDQAHHIVNMTLWALIKSENWLCLALGIWWLEWMWIRHEIRKQGDKLESKGVIVTSSGIKIQTKFDLTLEDLIQRASQKAQAVKSKIECSPEIARFGQKTVYQGIKAWIDFLVLFFYPITNLVWWLWGMILIPWVVFGSPTPTFHSIHLRTMSLVARFSDVNSSYQLVFV